MTRLKKLILFVGLIAAILITIPSGAVAQNSRPAEEATEVEMSVVLLDLERIEDTSQSFTANVFFVAQWRDPRLANENSETHQYDLNEVWNPRLQVVNRQQISLTLPQVVDVTADGLVTYRQRAVGSFTQKLDLVDFPLDHQRFEIQIVAIGYSPDEIAFVPSSSLSTVIVPELTIPDRIISNAKTGIQAYQPLSTIRPTAGFVLSFEAIRKLGFFYSKVIFPLMLVVGMSLMVLWIDPEVANPRVGIPVTSMLTLIAYRFMVANMIPKISYLTRLDMFILASTVLVFLTLVQSAWSVMTVRGGFKERALAGDRIVRWVFPLSYAIVFFWAFWA